MNVILIIYPFLMETGRPLIIDADIYQHYRASFIEAGWNVFEPKYIKDSSGNFTIDYENLTSIENSIAGDFIIFIEGNFSPDSSDCPYGKGLSVFLERNLNKVFTLIPDLKEDRIEHYRYYVKFSRYIIVYSKIGCDWANKFFAVNKFIFYPTPPIPKVKFIKDFHERNYFISYIGTKKNFREKFILINRKFWEQSKSFIQIGDRSSSPIVSTSDYMKILSESKFVFVTRATLYDEFPISENKFANRSIGRFAGRVSETIAAGAIPVYWHPKPSNSKMRALLNRYFFEKNSIFLSYILMFFVTDSQNTPYDDIKKVPGLIHLNYIRQIDKLLDFSMEDMDVHRKNLNSFYNQYICPTAFLKFLKDLL